MEHRIKKYCKKNIAELSSLKKTVTVKLQKCYRNRNAQTSKQKWKTCIIKIYLRRVHYIPIRLRLCTVMAFCEEQTVLVCIMDYTTLDILSLTHLSILALFKYSIISSNWSVTEITQCFFHCSAQMWAAVTQQIDMFVISHISASASLEAFCQLNVSHVLVLKSHLLCLKSISHCIQPIRTDSVLNYQIIKIKQNRYELYFMHVVKLRSHWFSIFITQAVH